MRQFEDEQFMMAYFILSKTFKMFILITEIMNESLNTRAFATILTASLASAPSIVNAEKLEPTVSREQYCETVGAQSRKDIARAFAETAEITGGMSMRLNEDDKNKLSASVRNRCLQESNDPNGRDRTECEINADSIARLVEKVLAESAAENPICLSSDRIKVARDAIQQYEQAKCLRQRGLRPLNHD